MLWSLWPKPLHKPLHNVDYYYGLTDMAGLTIQHVVQNKQPFVRKLRVLKRNDFWDVSKWLVCAYKSSGSHLDHQQKPVLIRDDKIKWLDFGKTPNPENLEAHPGFVWVKSGYSEAIPWRKVQLTKQRNVDLTTNGLWPVPLNTGWVPVRGNVCPARARRATLLLTIPTSARDLPSHGEGPPNRP